MKFSDMIIGYKNNPTQDKKDEIIKVLVSLENPEDLDGIICLDDVEWHYFGNSLRVKKIGLSKYIVTEVFSLSGRFICYCYMIDIDNFTDAEIEGYKKNCKEFQNVTTDEFFTVAAIAATLDEEDAKKTAVFHDKDGVNEWLNSIEKEIW